MSCRTCCQGEFQIHVCCWKGSFYSGHTIYSWSWVQILFILLSWTNQHLVFISFICKKKIKPISLKNCCGDPAGYYCEDSMETIKSNISTDFCDLLSFFFSGIFSLSCAFWAAIHLPNFFFSPSYAPLNNFASVFLNLLMHIFISNWCILFNI